MENHKIPCSNCKGVGYIPHFKHVEDGICFTCHGAGWVEVGQDAYNEYLKQLEMQKQGKYVLFDRGEVKYYQTEDEIREEYGKFKSGEYGGWAVSKSYRNPFAVYVKHTNRTPEFLDDVSKAYAEDIAELQKMMEQYQNQMKG